MASRRRCLCRHCPRPSHFWSIDLDSSRLTRCWGFDVHGRGCSDPYSAVSGLRSTGSQDVLCANALIYFASAVCLVPIRLPWSRLPHPQGGTIAATFQDLMEGLRYALVSQRTIVVLILLASIYTFAAGAYTTLFPVFGKKMLALGPVEVGYLWSWLGVGLFLVSLALVPLSKWDSSRRVLVVAVSSVIGGAALCGLVWTQSLVVATVLVTIIGMGFGTWTPIAWSMIPGIRTGSHGGASDGDLYGSRDGNINGRHLLFRVGHGAG